MEKKGIVLVIVFLFLLFVVGFAIDYFNLPSFFGLNMKNINYDIQNIVVSIITTFGLFLITYLLIERHNIRRQKNQYEIAKYSLQLVYMTCERLINQLDKEDKKFLKKEGKEIVSMYEKQPFYDDQLIMQLGVDGAIPFFWTERYQKIKANYSLYVKMFVFMDNDISVNDPLRKSLMRKIHDAQKELEINKPIYYTDEDIREMTT